MTPFTKQTKYARSEQAERNWVVVDATNQTLGRLAAQVAMILRGKTKPSFTPSVDCGDFVIVINADKISLAAKRAESKEYYSNTYYPGGARFTSFKNMMKHKPEYIIEHAVKGMLPKNILGREIGRKLKVYAGPNHPHAAQQPKAVELPYQEK